MLLEAGKGTRKITIENAPLDMEIYFIIDELTKYGTVTEIRNEHLCLGNTKTWWLFGPRHAYSRDMEPIPPTLKLKYNDSKVKVTIRNYGQTQIECRRCHAHVPRDNHLCEKKPEKKCYNCCSTDNLKHQCSDLPSCYTCSGSGHMARECSGIQHKTQFPSPEQRDDREEAV